MLKMEAINDDGIHGSSLLDGWCILNLTSLKEHDEEELIWIKQTLKVSKRPCKACVEMHLRLGWRVG